MDINAKSYCESGNEIASGISHFTGPVSTGITNPIETITFPQFRAENIAFDTSAGTINVTGKCNVTAPTSVRSA